MIFPSVSRLTNVFAVPNVDICAVFNLEISIVLSFKIAVIFPLVYVKSISVLSVADMAVFASVCARTDE